MNPERLLNLLCHSYSSLKSCALYVLFIVYVSSDLIVCVMFYQGDLAEQSMHHFPELAIQFPDTGLELITVSANKTVGKVNSRFTELTE